jgi:hypothetical protein
MADQPPDPIIEARLREYLATESRKAEVDFPSLPMRERPRTRGARLLGILVAAIAIIAFVVAAPRFLEGGSVGRGGTPTESPDGPTASMAAPSAAPSYSPSASAMTASASAGPSGNLPSGNGDCGRISSAACAKAIDLARKGHEAEVVGATRIVVDDACPPTMQCDRKYPFDAIVVFVTAGADTTGWYNAEVVGLKDDQPNKVQAWQGDVPAHIVAQLRAPQPSP